MLISSEPTRCLFLGFLCSLNHQVRLKSKPYLSCTTFQSTENSQLLGLLRPEAKHTTKSVVKPNKSDLHNVVFSITVCIWPCICKHKRGYKLLHRFTKQYSWDKALDALFENTRALMRHGSGQCESCKLFFFLIYYSCHRPTILCDDAWSHDPLCATKYFSSQPLSSQAWKQNPLHIED